MKTRFNTRRAKHAVDFFEKLLVHTKSPWDREPFKLAAFQRDIVRPLFGRQILDPDSGDWVRQYTLAWLEMARKNGKACSVTTPVPTPAGWATMGSLVVGDEVFDDEGNPTRVVGATEVMLGRPCYRLSFSDGEQIVADASHLWLTHARVQGLSDHAHALRTTEELFKTQIYGIRGDRTHSVAVAGALRCPPSALPMDPYVLGAWLGDGTTLSAGITGTDDQVWAEIEAAGYTVNHHADPRSHWISGLQTQLRSLGVLGNKHIPTAYLRGSLEQRLSLLQGLMDTDGYIASRGVGGNITQCEFTSTTLVLAEGTLELVRSLGLKATLKEGRATLNGKDCGPKYRIMFTAFDDTPVFRLSRKLRRMRPPPAAVSRSQTRQIVAVEPVESVPVRCIQVDNASGMFLLGNSFIPTHNSELLAGIALLLTGADDEEGAEVYGVAKDTEQASHVFAVARRMVELSPALSEHFVIYPTNKRIVYPKTASFYRVIASDALGNLGQNPHGILVDEVVAQPNGELWDALKTGFGTRLQPLMVGATTAGPETAEFARSEHDFSLRVAANPALDPRRFVFIRNLPKDVDWRDESRWGEANPALGLFLRPQVLRDELTTAENHPREERSFRMFRLNQWQPGGVDGWDAADVWPENAGMVVEDKLKGKAAWGGMAAMSATDLAALCWTFENPEGPGLWVLWRYFLPEDRLSDLRARTAGEADAWVKQGHLQLTEGDEIDVEAIADRIRADAKTFDVRQWAFVKSSAIGISQRVIADRIVRDDAVTAVSLIGGGSSLVDWEAYLRRGEYNHGANPVMAWQIAHVVTKTTETGTAISQTNSSENIYGPIAAEIAMRRYLVTSKERSRKLVSF